MKDMQEGGVVWITGLAGSGKSYIAQSLYEAVKTKYKNTIYLDGDEFREILGNFSYDKQGRLELSFKRAAFANFLSKQGMIVIVSAISMWNEIYEYNRNNINNYFEIYVKCDFDELVKRDKKHLYSRALNKELANVVGVDIDFDEPKADLVLDNTNFISLDKELNGIIKKIGL